MARFRCNRQPRPTLLTPPHLGQLFHTKRRTTDKGNSSFTASPAKIQEAMGYDRSIDALSSPESRTKQPYYLIKSILTWLQRTILEV
ncbi:MAG: hypothetical protein GDA56_21640 [Hormoscilla sp. GM7CHS1pb]|nr:hypothetical protein [Hormoscilla sp. GM7CHS1pb]